MLSWIKKYFIPNEGNDHRPHILRNYNIRSIVSTVIFLEIIIFLIPTLVHVNMTGGIAAVLPAVMAQLTNQERQSQKLNILIVNPILNKAAEMKARDMATKGYFAHTSPEGKTPWYWLEKVGYKYQYAGENLAINFSDSKDLAGAWMASPAHKANIIKENYTEIGTGVATGMYEGKETVFVAQIYANPLLNIEDHYQPVLKEIEKAPMDAIGEERADILGAEVAPNIIKPVQNPTFWQKTFASPRNTTNEILYIFFGMIIIALLLYIFIKKNNHHRDLITNGLIVLAIIGAIFIANYYLTHHAMIITERLDYSVDGKL